MINLLIILQAIAGGVVIAKVSAAFGAALSVFAAAFGISKIGVSAMEAIARQPEAAGDIRSNMVVSGALIEGVAFFAIVVCLLILFV